MLELLKNSKGKILNLFFKDADREYYFREIARILGKEPGHYQRAINSLVEEGILQDERKGNLRFFKLNKNYALYEEIKKIISKTIGVEARLKEIVNSVPGIDYAFIFGSIAKNSESSNSDIDLMLIGDINQDVLIEKISKLESELNREINYHTYSRQEAIKKLQDKENFFTNIFTESIIPLKGNIYEFTKFYK